MSTEKPTRTVTTKTETQSSFWTKRFQMRILNDSGSWMWQNSESTYLQMCGQVDARPRGSASMFSHMLEQLMRSRRRQHQPCCAAFFACFRRIAARRRCIAMCGVSLSSID